MNRLLATLIVGIVACSPAGSLTLTDQQRAAVTDSVKAHSTAWKTAAERADADQAMSHYHNTPDMAFVRAGRILSFDSLQAELRRDFAGSGGQQLGLTDQRITVLNAEAAVETTAGSWASTDSSGTRNGSFGLTRLWTLRDGKWGILHSNLNVVYPPVPEASALRRR